MLLLNRLQKKINSKFGKNLYAISVPILERFVDGKLWKRIAFFRPSLFLKISK